MFESLVKGLLLGIGAAVPLGPVNVEIARRTLRHGFRAGLALGCGAVTVDVTYAILATLGVSVLASYHGILSAIQLAGAILLTYLGAASLRSALRAAKSNPLELAETPQTSISALRTGYLTGLAMTLLNPMTLLFWFTAIPSAMGAEPDRVDLPIISMGVFIATACWVCFFAGTLKWLRRWRRQWWMTTADALGGVMLLGFAAYAFWTSMARSL